MKSPIYKDIHFNYRADIDGLRAIAVLAVVAFHAFPNWVKGGFVGVDVFFVISGYLISSIIFTGLEQGSFSYRDFYARRIRRIFPALITVLIACLLFGKFSLFTDEYMSLGRHVAAGAGFISNIVLWREAGYFDVVAELKPLLHLWSLGIEEQFYIFWPLLVVMAYKRSKLMPVLFIILMASFLCNILAISSEPAAVYYLPVTRFWELLIGALLAYLTLFKGGLIPFLMPHLSSCRGKKVSEIFSWLGFLLIAISIFIINKEKLFPGWLALLPTFGAFFLIGSGCGSWFNRKVLGCRPLVYIGLVSYPLYLWHWPVLSFLRIMEMWNGVPTRNMRLGAVIISFVLAILTFEFLEKRIRIKATAFTAAVLFIVMILVGGYGFFMTISSESLSSYEETKDLAQKFNWPKNLERSDECFKLYGSTNYPSLNQYCLIKDINSKPSVALIGDSHSNQFFWGLENNLNNENIINIGAGGCLPFFNTDRSPHLSDGNLHCKEKVEAYLNFVATTSSIKTIVIAFSGSTYLNDETTKLIDTDEITSTDKEYIMRKNFDITLHRLILAGKTIIVILDNPLLDFDPKSCVFHRPLQMFKSKVSDACSINREVAENFQKKYRDIVKETAAKYPSIRVFDPFQVLCDQKECFAIQDDKILYRDWSHLSYDGSFFVSNIFDLK